MSNYNEIDTNCRLFKRIEKELKKTNHSTVLNFNITDGRYGSAIEICNNHTLNFYKNNDFLFLNCTILSPYNSTSMKYFLCKINFEKFNNFLKTKSKNKKISVLKPYDFNTIFINYIYKRHLIVVSSSIESDISKICEILYENKKISDEAYLKYTLNNSSSISALI